MNPVNNDTFTHEHGDLDATWIVLPVIFACLVYLSFAIFVWPYARPAVSLWILLICLLFPPVFFLLATYVLLLLILRTPEYTTTNPPTVLVVQRPPRSAARV